MVRIPQFPGSPKYVFPGNATFNIEFDRPNVGFACIDQGRQIHGSRKNFDLKIESNRFSGNATFTSAFDWKTNEIITVEESIKRQKQEIPDVFYLVELAVHDGFIDNHTLTCKWTGSHQGLTIKGEFQGRKFSQTEPSSCDELKSWEKFKVYVAKLIQDGHEFIFRGQPSNQHRLNTSFHRERRYDLLRYEAEACEHLVQNINAISTRQYNRKDSIDFGALLSLAQHHGFPTPLLDWSKSPYVAAFFALEKCSRPNENGDNPRIYIFDALAWQRDTAQAAHFADPRPVITLREFVASNNPRHLPQQSIHTYTNIEDIEAWIRLIEKEKNKRYLTIIDIPSSERKFAMRDLAYMGVTAATLFPGFDGVCRSLKGRFFPHN
ncbi:MAG TPA: FRG domain-containing protein [Verrucomicrobiae bacterium]|nr:FRG domain-containing protein [Verrucomicrobiae bacterium]